MKVIAAAPQVRYEEFAAGVGSGGGEAVGMVDDGVFGVAHTNIPSLFITSLPTQLQ